MKSKTKELYCLWMANYYAKRVIRLQKETMETRKKLVKYANKAGVNHLVSWMKEAKS